MLKPYRLKCELFPKLTLRTIVEQFEGACCTWGQSNQKFLERAGHPINLLIEVESEEKYKEGLQKCALKSKMADKDLKNLFPEYFNIQQVESDGV